MKIANEDYISREEVKARFQEWTETNGNPRDFWNILCGLPSIQSERPKGEWIASSFVPKYGPILHECNQCHKYSDWESDFCPNCGADMRGDEDAED